MTRGQDVIETGFDSVSRPSELASRGSGVVTDSGKSATQPIPVAEVFADMPGCEEITECLANLVPASPELKEVLCDVLRCCHACAGSGQHQEVDGKLLPLGSFQLGVMRPVDVLDLIFVAPPAAQVPKLRDAVAAHLEAETPDCNVSPVSPQGHFTAPGLAFTMKGIEVKLLFAQRVPGLPDPQPDAMASNMAAIYAHEALKSLQKCVPNEDVFRSLLKFVCHWARQRGIYGHFLGFLGGPAWAVCCARVCQMHPQVEASQLVQRFFRTLYSWDWRKPLGTLPEVHGRPEPTDPTNQGQLTMDVHLPLGSGLSIAPHVSETTSKIMLKELLRGYKVAQQVGVSRAQMQEEAGREQNSARAPIDLSPQGWPDLVSRSMFFQGYRHYLEFQIMALTEEILRKWLAWTKQCMSEFTKMFEKSCTGSVTLRPWPEVFEIQVEEWPHARTVFFGMQVERAEGQIDGHPWRYDLRQPTVYFLEHIIPWEHAEQYRDKFEFVIKHTPQNDAQQRLESQPRDR